MEDQVPFKVYMFWKDNDKPEVRRFGVEKSVVTSFHYLNAKIQDVYPGVRGKAYSVFWKDEEGDDVVISSDDEVMTALQALNGDVIKLFVKCKGGDTKDEDVDIVITATTENAAEPAGPGTLHYGVCCDSCDGPVVGFRYKCTTCDDFDLCSRCEAAGCHPDHCMVRVPTPTMPRTVIKAAIKRSRHFLKTVPGAVGEDCPYRKHRRDRSGERRHRGDHGPQEDHHRDRDHRHRRTRTSWLEIFGTYMNEFANLAGDINLDPAPKTQEKPQDGQEQAKQRDGQEKPQDGQEKAKTSAQSTEAPKPQAPQMECPLIPGVNADQIKGFLNMYLGNNTNSEATQTTEQPRASTSAQTAVSVEQITTLLKYLGKDLAGLFPQPSDVASASGQDQDTEMGQGDRQASNGRKASNASNVTAKTESSASSEDKEHERDASPDKADDWTVINKEKDLMDTTASAPLAAPIGFNLPEEFRDRVKISQSGLYPPLNTATAELEDAPVLQPQPVGHQSQAQKPTAPLQTASAPVQTENTASAPVQAKKPVAPQAQPQPRQRHPKPHIDVAIQHMLAMGFTNEGGWLTQLLESKDGNIAAVLDLLTPIQPK